MAGEGGVRLGVVRAGAVPAASMAEHSRAALDRPLAEGTELWVAVASDAAALAGAFQRTTATPPGTVRRGSGGPEVRVAPGTVHVALSLARPDALEPCDPRRIVNRAVRPLLRALTKTAALAHYFGRDWVSVGHRPAAWVGFAHDAASGRTLFEAFVAVRTPFATAERGSFRGKQPATLEEVAGRVLDPTAIADAIAEAYLAKHDATEVTLSAPVAEGPAAPPAIPEPPWTATVEEAIGPIGAGPDAAGVFRVGGDLLVSRDALARLEARVAAAADDDVGRAVDEILGPPSVALHGVASLASIRDVILAARADKGRR
jgi:hypothetical protein